MKDGQQSEEIVELACMLRDIATSEAHGAAVQVPALKMLQIFFNKCTAEDNILSEDFDEVDGSKRNFLFRHPTYQFHGCLCQYYRGSPPDSRFIVLGGRSPLSWLSSHAVRGNKPNGSEVIINSELWISSFSSKIASSGGMSVQTDLLAAMMNVTAERQIDAKVFHGWSSAVRSKPFQSCPCPPNSPLSNILYLRTGSSLALLLDQTASSPGPRVSLICARFRPLSFSTRSTRTSLKSTVTSS